MCCRRVRLPLNDSSGMGGLSGWLGLFRGTGWDSGIPLFRESEIAGVGLQLLRSRDLRLIPPRSAYAYHEDRYQLVCFRQCLLALVT